MCSFGTTTQLGCKHPTGGQDDRLLLLRARLLSLLLVVLVVAGMVVLGMGQRLDDKIDRYRWQTLDTFRCAKLKYF